MNKLFSSKEGCSTKETEIIENISVLDNVNEHFKTPMYYNKDKVELKENIAIDLELVTTIDPSNNPMYSFYFNNDNDVS